MNVKCLCCREEVYQFVRRVDPDELIRASLLKGINGYEDPKNSHSFKCPSCDDLLRSIREAFSRLVVDNA